MNLCNFAKVIISRCTKDASTINWWNENACSSDQISFEKYKYKLPRIQKYITNSKYWKNNNKNGEKMEFIRVILQ